MMNTFPFSQKIRWFFSWRENPVLAAGCFLVLFIAALSWYILGEIEFQIQRDLAGIDAAKAHGLYGTIRGLTVSAVFVMTLLTTLLFLGLTIIQAETAGARMQQARARLESEKRLNAAMNSIIDSVIVIDERGTVESVNAATERVFGYSAEELLGNSVNRLMPEPHKSGHDAYIRNYLQTGKAKILGLGREMTGMKKDGTMFPADLAVSEIHLGDRRLFAGIVRDISDRKRFENELRDSREQLRSLAVRLQEIQEDERKRVAREIHDEMGQTLTIMKMNAVWIGDNLPASREDALTKARLISRLADHAMDSMRGIVSGLRPGILDDFGVSAAIEWHAMEFQESTGMECVLNLDPEEMPVDPHRALSLFRIYQEAMTNVVRHARGANRIVVRLRKEDGRILLEVRDNGCGIAGDRVSGSRSLGLLGMRERARSWGGSVEIAGRDGEGTSVVVQIPVQ